jgi:hypothetical protein
MEGANPHGGAAMFGPDETDDINDTPTVLEYKKLKRVMRIMIKFYEDGSQAKLDQAEDHEYELQKVEADLKMVEAQIEALKPFPVHPKRTEYETELLEERDALVNTRNKIQNKVKEFRALHVWSLGIVEATRWLALGLDDYCVNHLKLDLNIKPVPLEKPTTELYRKYKRGLDEITENLHESQDFFQASLDGRLRKYHQIEKDIIEAQLKVISEFPPMNPRQQHIEGELQKDLEYVTENMKESPAGNAKKERMLSMHKDFVTVLSWFKHKLADFATELGVTEEDGASIGDDAGTKPTNKQVEFIQKHL